MAKLDIHVVAAVIRDEDGRILTVRKRGTTAFMFPGGKPEPGESPEAALIRELAEEIGVAAGAHHLTELGHFTAPAASEPGHTVRAHVFTAAGLDGAEPTTRAGGAKGTAPTGGIRPAAEIEELRWIKPSAIPADTPLAPLLRDHVLPFLAQ